MFLYSAVPLKEKPTNRLLLVLWHDMTGYNVKWSLNRLFLFYSLFCGLEVMAGV